MEPPPSPMEGFMRLPRGAGKRRAGGNAQSDRGRPARRPQTDAMSGLFRYLCGQHHEHVSLGLAKLVPGNDQLDVVNAP